MTHPQQQEAAWQLMDRIYKRVVEATPGQPWPTTAFYDFGVPILEAALSAGAAPQPTRHRCSGCGHLWDARTTTAELCGDCWRRVQHVLHAGSVGADLDTARTLARTHRMPRDPFAEQLSEAILSLASEVETLRRAACPQHGDPLVCLACEAEEDQHPAWEAAQTETFRDWLARQLEACRARAVNDNTKKSREYHGHTSILLHGILAEYDRRATGEGARDEGMVSGRSGAVRGRVAADQHRGSDSDVVDVPLAVSLDPHRLLREMLQFKPPPGPPDPPKPKQCPNGHNLIWVSPTVALCEARDWEPLWILDRPGAMASRLRAAVHPESLSLAHAVRRALELARLRGEAAVRVEE
jgi:hypothetical protein